MGRVTKAGSAAVVEVGDIVAVGWQKGRRSPPLPPPLTTPICAPCPTHPCPPAPTPGTPDPVSSLALRASSNPPPGTLRHAPASHPLCASCYECRYCRLGDENICVKGKIATAANGNRGGFADKWRGDSRFAFKLPKKLCHIDALKHAGPLMCGRWSSLQSPHLHTVPSPSASAMRGQRRRPRRASCCGGLAWPLCPRAAPRFSLAALVLTGSSPAGGLPARPSGGITVRAPLEKWAKPTGRRRPRPRRPRPHGRENGASPRQLRHGQAAARAACAAVRIRTRPCRQALVVRRGEDRA